MRNIFIGPPNSGKSALAEQFMLRQADSSIAYIATLPPVLDTGRRIERHKARRGPEWKTWDMVDSGLEALRLIERALQVHRHMLLDGLSILVWRTCVREGHFGMHCAQTFLNRLTMLLGSTERDWIIVDTDQPYPKLGADDPFNRLMHRTHETWRRLAAQA